MNEVDPNDTTDFGASPPMATTIGILSLFHFICCGGGLLLLSGVSLATIFPWWPVIGGALPLLALLRFLRMRRTGLRSARPPKDHCCANKADERSDGIPTVGPHSFSEP